MGELLGVPEWLVATVFVVAALSIWMMTGLIMHRRGQSRLSVKRASPTRDEFVKMLSDDVDGHIAQWLWDQVLPYYQPLTPHPDDHLVTDAMIDDDDIDMGWWRDFARAMKLDEKFWPEWPPEWNLTVRNYGRWLQRAREQQI